MTASTSSVSLSELAGLDDGASRARLRSLVPVPSAKKIAQLQAEIERFEAKHGLSSEVMRSRLATGELEETLDVCDWLMALKLRARLVAARSR